MEPTTHDLDKTWSDSSRRCRRQGGFLNKFPGSGSIVGRPRVVFRIRLGLTFLNTSRAVELSRLHGNSFLSPCRTRLVPHASMTTRASLSPTSSYLPNFQPMTNLGKHDVIIGKNWLARHDLWLDMKNERLLACKLWQQPVQN